MNKKKMNKKTKENRKIHFINIHVFVDTAFY